VPVFVEQSETGSAIRLQGNVNINCAAELKQILLRALLSAGPVSISFGELTDADVTTLQLLWAAAREAQSAAKPLTFSGTLPDDLRLSLELAGFGNFPPLADRLSQVDGCR
jgi:anti-anti-sigma regulatory factor